MHFVSWDFDPPHRTQLGNVGFNSTEMLFVPEAGLLSLLAFAASGARGYSKM
jgi:hypothetical protein